MKSLSASEMAQFYGCGLVRFSGHNDALYERHLVFDHVLDPRSAYVRARYEALAGSIRDLLCQRWLATQKSYDVKNPKIVYYLSMEFLIGRSLMNNVLNLMVESVLRDVVKRHRLDLVQVIEQEPDAGLGNGGLGRLAACFIDSLATLQIPAFGYGLRYQYGIFRQEISNGYQVERPDNWLRCPDPWETERPTEVVPLQLHAAVRMDDGAPKLVRHEHTLLGVPFDRPVVGYGGKTINTLRLWEAATPDFFDLDEFNTGDYVGAVFSKVMTENLTRVLYPDDSTQAGQRLRFLQEYFLVACSLADIIRRFRENNDWQALPDKVAIQLNDTHPALAVAELMRILLDQAGLGWDNAWDLTQRTLAYTNHTLLPEALEKWPVDLFEVVLPRKLEIIYEINRRFLNDVRRRFPNDDARLGRMSLIEESGRKQVRMAHLAIVGTHSTNGVAKIHSDLLRKTVVPDFAEMFPERFGNKTNGVTPRRWLLLANPALAELISATIGDGWITDLSQLRQLQSHVGDSAFRDAFRKAKRTAKTRFGNWLRRASGTTADPDSIFDSQIKRIHEYKRQLLNVLHIIILYDRLRANPSLDAPPRTFFFAGKAAPAYRLAKLIIKLINSVAKVIDADRVTAGRLKVIFVPDYKVSMAESLIPASDISEQISTAGYEASGTGNMKFMMNGALTIGTRDGATIEMAEEAGEDNFFLFGLTAEQVASNRGWYNPRWHYDHEPETRAALDLIGSNHFSRNEPGIFQPILETLFRDGDRYMHLADLTSYGKAHAAAGELYRRADEWTRKSIINVACSGKFSSDRTIREYAKDIWGAVPVPVE
jgi:starch phosphorylase